MSLFRKRFPARRPADQAAARAPQPVAPPPPPPDFLRDSEVRTSLGADAVISGRLSFTTPTRIEGKLKGELRCTALCIIGSTAVVEGAVKAEELRVEGLVRGEIIETEKLEIMPSGKVLGRVQVQTLVVRDGGILDGECRMGLEDIRAARGRAGR